MPSVSTPKKVESDRMEITILREKILKKIGASPRKATAILSEWVNGGDKNSRKQKKVS